MNTNTLSNPTDEINEVLYEESRENGYFDRPKFEKIECNKAEVQDHTEQFIAAMKESNEKLGQHWEETQKAIYRYEAKRAILREQNLRAVRDQMLRPDLILWAKVKNIFGKSRIIGRAFGKRSFAVPDKDRIKTETNRDPIEAFIEDDEIEDAKEPYYPDADETNCLGV
jgi:hypothetical protein